MDESYTHVSNSTFAMSKNAKKRAFSAALFLYPVNEKRPVEDLVRGREEWWGRGLWRESLRDGALSIRTLPLLKREVSKQLEENNITPVRLMCI
jgi:hypothetical protein